MRTYLLIALLVLTGVASASAQFPGQYPRGPGWGTAPQVRIWIDNERDYFRHGDRMRVNFSSSADAYVAVVHIDPDGRLEFLYPSSPWDPEFVVGRRVYPLGHRGGAAGGWPVRGGAGIGYLYVVASPFPLDFSYFRGRSGSAWDWSYAGQVVRGDPFWALEQLTRHLVPGWGFTPIAVHYHSYQVDGFHRYPAYACANRLAPQGWGWGWGAGYVPSYYASCARLDPYLLAHPYYFDARRFRGDRSTFFRNFGPAEPLHRFREDPRARPSTGVGITPAPRATPAAPAPARGGRATPAAPAPGARPAPAQGNTSGNGGTTSEPQRRPAPDGAS